MCCLAASAAAVAIAGLLGIVWAIGGLLACVFYAAAEVGGFSAMFDALPAERWQAFDPSTGIRHVRTCYGEREELLSSIRMIERARAAKKLFKKCKYPQLGFQLGVL